MLENPLVSVVIPVYNVENWLQESLDCIRNQTYTNLEIICVNDGSTDGSRAILQANAESDKRIRIFHQENRGQSEARNNGVRQASGKYLYFMDSDDLFEKDGIERLVRCAEENRFELVAFDADAFATEESQQALCKKYNVWYRRDDIYASPCKGSELLRKLAEHGQFVAPVCFLFMQRSFFEQKTLWFHAGIVMEDFPVTAAAFLCAEKMGYLHETLFHRRVRSGSTMTKKLSFRNPYGYFAGMLDIADYIENHQISLTPDEWKAVKNLLGDRLRRARGKYAQLDEEEKEKVNELPVKERILFDLLISGKQNPENMSAKQLARIFAKKAVRKGKKLLSPADGGRKAPAAPRMLYNEESKGKIEALQRTIDEIIAEIDRLCRKNDIPYFLYGGTLLGAARDGRFIPWDDDADLAMLYDDFLRFTEVCKTQLDGRFFCQTSFTDPGYPKLILKIRKNGTYFREPGFDGKEMHQGVYVDVFPLVRFPDSKRLGNMQLKWMSIVHQLCSFEHCHSNHLSAKLFFKLGKRLPAKFWYRVRKASLEFCHKHSGRNNVCSFASHYQPLRKRVLKAEWFSGCRDMEFDGMTLMAPIGAEEYLKHLYGENYTDPPAAGERFIHSDLDSLKL